MHRAVALLLSLVSAGYAGDGPAVLPRTTAVVARAAAKPELTYKTTYKVGEKIVWVLKNATAESDIDWGLPEAVQYEAVGSTCYIWAAPGTYSVDGDVIDWTGKARTRWRFKFTVGDAPAPPTPVDPTDPVVQALTDRLKPAFASDADPFKAANVAKLAAMYGNCGDVTADKSFATWNGLLAAMQAKRKKTLADTDIPSVRRALADWLNSKFPTSDKPLDDAGRALAASTFATISKALAGVTK